jgi:hypothetical protein
VLQSKPRRSCARSAHCVYGKNGQIEKRSRFEPKLLDRGHLFVLGRAALDGDLQRLFEAERVTIWDRGFQLENVRYVSDGDAISRMPGDLSGVLEQVARGSTVKLDLTEVVSEFVPGRRIE